MFPDLKRTAKVSLSGIHLKIIVATIHKYVVFMV